MRSIKVRGFYRTLFILLVASIFLSQCAHELKPLENVLDSREHHALTGFKLTEKGYFEDAKREFELALKHNLHYSFAHRGLGLLHVMRGDFRSAAQSLGRARDYAESKEDKAMAYVGFMQLSTVQKGKGWLHKVEENFSEASSIMKELPEAHYRMGIAYKEANQLSESARAFKQVLAINKGLVAEAERELRLVEGLRQDSR